MSRRSSNIKTRHSKATRKRIETSYRDSQQRLVLDEAVRDRTILDKVILCPRCGQPE